MREGLAALRQNARAVVRQQLARAGEQKFIFDRIAATSTAAGAVTQIAQTAQGDANGQRDGLKTTHKSLRFKYVVNNAGNSQGTCRVIIFKWFRDYNNAQQPHTYCITVQEEQIQTRMRYIMRYSRIGIRSYTIRCMSLEETTQQEQC